MSDKLTHSTDTPKSQMTDLAGSLLTEVEGPAPSDAMLFLSQETDAVIANVLARINPFGQENFAEVSGRPATSNPSTNAESMQGAVGTGPTLP